MARQFTNGFYTSAAWYKCRRSYISSRMAIDGGMCEDCHENPGKIVHHKIHISESNINDPDVTLNHRNLKYVCLNCHNIVEHGYGRRAVQDEISYTFDRDGNPVPVREE